MAEPIEIRFEGHNGSVLSLAVEGYSHPQSEDYWDGNWVKSRINVAVGGFNGDVRGDLRLDEFQHLLDELKILQKTLDRKVIFTTTELWFEFKIEGDNLGHLEFQGTLWGYWNADNLLQFTFQSDQTYLSNPIKQLETVLSHFPIKGRP